MDGIFDRLYEFILDALRGWTMSNLGSMFGDVNDKVGTIASDVAQTPLSWNPSIYTMIRRLSEDVMLPIAGVIISYVLCYELISMIIDDNSMKEVDTWMIFRYLAKACIAVLLLSHTFDITMAVFEMGQNAVNRAGVSITESTSIDIGPTIMSMFGTYLMTASLGDLIGFALESMIVTLCMKIMSLLITVIIFGRMIEIYLTISMAPIPFATFTNREWGNIGTNYIRGLLALAFQGFFIMVCVGIYSVMIKTLPVSTDLSKSLWGVMAYTAALCFSLLKTGNLAKSIFNVR